MADDPQLAQWRANQMAQMGGGAGASAGANAQAQQAQERQKKEAYVCLLV